MHNILFRLGETCSHVAALLFKIETAIRLGYTRQTCTDIPCAWNQTFVKKVQPAAVCDIEFYSENAKKRVKRDTNPIFVQPSEECQNLFLQQLSQCTNKPVCLSLFKEYGDMFKAAKSAQPDPKIPLSLRSDLDQIKLSFSCNKLHLNYIIEFSKHSIACSFN
jgi:hypothetical protein